MHAAREVVRAARRAEQEDYWPHYPRNDLEEAGHGREGGRGS